MLPRHPHHAWGCLTWHGALWLPSSRPRVPGLAQRILKHAREVVAEGGLVQTSSQALLLQVLQGAIGAPQGLAVEGPR